VLHIYIYTYIYIYDISRLRVKDQIHDSLRRTFEISYFQLKQSTYYNVTLIYRVLDTLQDTVTKIPIGQSYNGHSFIIQDYVVIFYKCLFVSVCN